MFRMSVGFGYRGTGMTALLALGVASASAQWLQWGGPTRDFKVDCKGLAAQWPADGPKKLWSRDLPDGYSAILVDGDMLYTMGRTGDNEAVLALNAKTGETIWEHAYEAAYPDGLDKSFGIGPRATPLVVGDRIYSAGVSAVLKCLDKKTGKQIWSHDLAKEFGANFPMWGYASSPLLYKQTIIVPVGGDGTSVMAFDANDGNVVWKSGSGKNSYSSPILINVGGEDQVVVLMAAEVVGIDANSGENRWSHAHVTQHEINATTPVFGPDGVLFLSSAYDSGSRALKLTRAGDQTNVEELWYSRKMRVHFPNVVRHGDMVYGSSGDNGPSFFAGVNVKTGETVFRLRNIDKATLVGAGDHLLLLDQKGQLMLAKPNDKGVDVLAKHQLLGEVAWTVPTLVGTKLYARDRQKIVALELGA